MTLDKAVDTDSLVFCLPSWPFVDLRPEFIIRVYLRNVLKRFRVLNEEIRSCTESYEDQSVTLSVSFFLPLRDFKMELWILFVFVFNLNSQQVGSVQPTTVVATCGD